MNIINKIIDMTANSSGVRDVIVFKKLRKLLKPFGIKRYCTDGLACYAKYLEQSKHIINKNNTTFLMVARSAHTEKLRLVPALK